MESPSKAKMTRSKVVFTNCFLIGLPGTKPTIILSINRLNIKTNRKLLLRLKSFKKSNKIKKYLNFKKKADLKRQ